MIKPVRVSLRRLTRAPGFAVASVVTVALAVGANSVILSAVRGLLVKSLPVAHADRLVWVYGVEAGAGDASRAAVYDREAMALDRARHLFASVAVIGDRSFVRQVGAQRMRWRG